MAQSHFPSTGVYIRRAIEADSPSLSRICLLTGDAGVSAEPLHEIGELIGMMYAEPYVHLPAGFGFVMVDSSKNDAVVGYVLGTADTRAFETQEDETWYPAARARYPYTDPPTNPIDPSKPLKEADIRYMKNIHNPPHSAAVNIAFSPAHMHIDILPEYQRQGWGKKLISEVVEYLREEKGLEKLWLGLDPRNIGARRFYEKLGFVPIQGAAEGIMGLDFKDFK